MGLLACALALAGCGPLTRITYNQADDLLFWWLDAYVDFNAEQSPRARDELAAWLQWHRAQELPAYADWLRQLQPLAGRDLGEAQTCAAADAMRQRLLGLLPHVQAAANWLAASLTPRQIEHLQRKFDKNNEEFERDWRALAPDALRKKRIQQARGRYEMLYGKLDAAQVAVITATVDAAPADLEGAYTERLRRQQDTLQTLRRIATDKPPMAEAQAMVLALLGRSFTSPNTAWRARAEAQWRETCASFARVHNSTTEAQRARALQTLQGYEADFRALAVRR